MDKNNKNDNVDLNAFKYHSSGKLEGDKEIEKIERLEKILGVNKVSDFGTNDLQVFEKRMASMNQAELKDLCVKVGVYPSGNRRELTVKLRQLFKDKTKGARTIGMQINNPILQPGTKEHEAAKKIIGKIH